MRNLRYRVFMIDTYDDTLITMRNADDLQSLKRAIIVALKDETGRRVYNPSDDVVLYIKDKEFFTPEGLQRIRSIPKNIYIDEELLTERGLDYDVWHDYYLTLAERSAYDDFVVRRKKRSDDISVNNQG